MISLSMSYSKAFAKIQISKRKLIIFSLIFFNHSSTSLASSKNKKNCMILFGYFR